MTSDTVLILDWGASHFLAARAAIDSKGNVRLLEVASEETPVSRDGELAEEQIVSSWSRLRTRLAIKKPVVLLISHPLPSLQVRALPTVATSHERNVFEFEARQAVGEAPGEVVWDYLVSTAERGDGKALFVYSWSRESLERRCQQLETAGIRVGRVLPSSVALSWAGHALSDITPGSTLLLEVGSRTSHICWHEGGRRAWASFPFGGAMVTKAIADEQGVSLAEAEPIQHTPAFGQAAHPPEATALSTSSTLMPSIVAPSPFSLQKTADVPAVRSGERAEDILAGRLQLEVTRFLVNQRKPGEAPPPTRLVVSGGGSVSARLLEKIASRLGLPVTRWELTTSVSTGVEEARRRVETALNGARLATVWGAAYLSLRCPEVICSWLPPARKHRLTIERRTRLGLGAAALVAASLLPPAWQYERSLGAVRAHIGTKGNAIAERTEWQRRLRENLRRISETQQEVAQLRQLSATRNNWGHFFADLQGKLAEVEDAWMDRLQFVKPAGGSGTQAPARFILSGRILEREKDAGVALSAEARVRSLLSRLRQSPFIGLIENERFDRNKPGLLGFEVMIRMVMTETL
ncbi:MAG TPA: hypothetical protein PLN52_18775 [Opitutaceae bacterium]|nr:hypothetical protein [Opitutaceae bacterium]